MKHDELEEMAKAIVEFHIGDCACEQDRMCIPCKLVSDFKEALKALRSKTRKEDAEIVKEYCGEVYFPDDMPHPDCIAQAILKKDEEEAR